MNEREIEEMLNRGKASAGPPPEVLARISESIAGSTRPVRPLPRRWLLAGGTILVCAVVALAGAAAMGLHGLIRMSIPERAAVFSIVGLLVFVIATELTNVIIPGRLRRASTGGLLAATSLSLAAVLGFCFRDFPTTRFMHAGLVCLAIGLLHATVAWFLIRLVLRRGFAVSPAPAGMVGGMLAGLAGLAMLELHCPNFQAAHVLVWHLGVLLASAALGRLLARLPRTSA